MRWRLTKEEMKARINNGNSDEKRLCRDAYWNWYKHYPFYQLEIDLEKLPKRVPAPPGGWIKATRQAQFLGVKGGSASLKITKTGITKLEAREKRRSISVKKLAEAADALNCDLVYYFKPKKNTRLSVYVWRQLFKMFKHEAPIKHEPQNRKGKVLAAYIRKRMKNAQFRKKMGWSLRDG